MQSDIARCLNIGLAQHRRLVPGRFVLAAWPSALFSRATNSDLLTSSRAQVTCKGNQLQLMPTVG